MRAGMAFKAFASGCSGLELSSEEQAFFRSERPCGLILFQRNCESPDQVRRLTEQAADAVGEEGFLVFIDQEGGRVRRLKPPHWRDYPPARAYGELYREDVEAGLEAARLSARLVAEELRTNGITLNATPVLDLPVAGAHDIIGDRAYGSEPEPVISLGRAVADGFMAGGVVPVMKHVPGHGRARVDSHESLPEIDAGREVLERSDFKPFAALSDLPAAMTAHVLLTAIDPERPASVSPAIIGGVIRDAIGFDGLLMSDDVSMQALEGSIGERTAGVIGAGCDIALHCNGVMTEMQAVADMVPDLAGKALERFDRARTVTERSEPFDRERAEYLITEVRRRVAG